MWQPDMLIIYPTRNMVGRVEEWEMWDPEQNRIGRADTLEDALDLARDMGWPTCYVVLLDRKRYVVAFDGDDVGEDIA